MAVRDGGRSVGAAPDAARRLEAAEAADLEKPFNAEFIMNRVERSPEEAKARADELRGERDGYVAEASKLREIVELLKAREAEKSTEEGGAELEEVEKMLRYAEDTANLLRDRIGTALASEFPMRSLADADRAVAELSLRLEGIAGEASARFKAADENSEGAIVMELNEHNAEYGSAQSSVL